MCVTVCKLPQETTLGSGAAVAYSLWKRVVVSSNLTFPTWWVLTTGVRNNKAYLHGAGVRDAGGCESDTIYLGSWFDSGLLPKYNRTNTQLLRRGLGT